MFKKLFKSLGGNLEDMAKDLMKDQQQQDIPNGHDANAHKDQLKAYMNGDMQGAFEAGAASAGMKTSNTAKEDPNDPNMQAVHGISIADYAAGAAKIGEGCTEEQICIALGVEQPMWDEAQTTWNNRMRDDNTFNVINVYTNYFGKAKEHGKLGGLIPNAAVKTDVSDGKAKEHLARLETDKHYFFEIQAALQAAYENGIDGAQWLIDNLGLTVAQVNGTGTKYMNDFNIMAEMMDYQDQKKAEYSKRFAEENGTGGVADDIEF